ncbi:MAG: hypothetical protein CMN91_07285 [Synechococcus sp. ARS1019]|nr:hypothetical protein [Synechococcus sp. ARS1019]|tara:strand:+ start:1149 stop:3356 length:2208 start_codon:yes stop_codon:yes gene_type:complete
MKKPTVWAICFLLSLALVHLPLYPTLAETSGESIEASTGNQIRLIEQPFYPELQNIANRWNRSYMGEVEGKTPQYTLLNFYGVMAKVASKIEWVSTKATTEPGFRWSEESKQTIKEAELLFNSAVESLDGSLIPESTRSDRREEAALKLKEILDYVLDNSSSALAIPNTSNDQDWRLPSTGIHLAKGKRNQDSPLAGDEYFFTPETINNIPRMYSFIKQSDRNPIENDFATPNLYKQYTYTPGQLVPPKWYLKLPLGIRNLFERPIGDQSLLQICLAFIVTTIYLPIVYILTHNFLSTFKHRKGAKKTSIWLEDNKAWGRLAFIAPIPPLSAFCNYLLDQQINLTNFWLEKSALILDIAFYVSLGLTILLLFEALGRSSSEWILSFRNSKSSVELKRINNIILPSCRFLGAISSIGLMYALLIRLGLPPSTVLAFSAVPGLAIGLGAQRILGNLFSGISIQTDRPVRIGDFCKVNNEEGFVTRIGLRSIELSTFSGRVTIPNSTFDSATIQSFSKHVQSNIGPIDSDAIGQNIELQLEMPSGLGIGHLNSIVDRIKDYAATQERISKISCSFCENNNGGIILSIVALSKTNQEWEKYLNIRQNLVSEIRLIVALIKNTKQMVSVGRQTKPELIEQIPNIIEAIINEDPQLSMSYCRLSSISDYSLDFVFNMEAKYTDIGEFLNAVAALKQKILLTFSNNGIHIPYPTSVELQTNPFEQPINFEGSLTTSEPSDAI